MNQEIARRTSGDQSVYARQHAIPEVELMNHFHDSRLRQRFARPRGQNGFLPF